MNIIDLKKFPRLPLSGYLDITYRCGNHCKHCWLWTPNTEGTKQNELSFDEIIRIVGEARQMGCQAWNLSGGEPLIRPDFFEIFDFLTRKSVSYAINTNGTLITPKIASLMKRPGRKMVALYGATEQVHDNVTRTPGSFKAMLRGFAYLKEAGAEFIVQIVPMRANYHQYDDMVKLAQSLSSTYRIGAPWLWLSACRSRKRNQEIKQQRLSPQQVITLDSPNPVSYLMLESTFLQDSNCDSSLQNNRVFASCIHTRNEFHIDPYGGMSFCSYIKDPALRFDLRLGSFQKAWDEFIPSLENIQYEGDEFQENCGICDLRNDCRWCAAYSYLEHGRYSAPIDYLCQVAKDNRQIKEEWKMSHTRYYQIADITIKVYTDFPLTNDTFAEKFDNFRTEDVGGDNVTIGLISGVPALSELKLGKEVYRIPPWAVYKQRDSWVYMMISEDPADNEPQAMAIVNHDYSRINVFRSRDNFSWINLHSLTSFISDQIFLAPILAERQACLLHSSGIAINGKGLIFVGHSDAGKSTMLKMLRGYGEILCDDRNIIRRWPEGFRIHGTWSHGELPDVSPASAPLRAILYLEQAKTNELIPIDDKRERLGKFLSHVVKALVTEDWWDKTLDLAGKVSAEVPAYRLKFDKSGAVAETLKQLYE